MNWYQAHFQNIKIARIQNGRLILYLCRNIGLLKGHTLKGFLNIDALVQKHICILAKTGGGKSYACGVLGEEFFPAVFTAFLEPFPEGTRNPEERMHSEE